MRETVSKPVLGVFFTYGVSVSTWKKQGMLSREISLYRALLHNPFEKIYFFTYGIEDPVLVAELFEMGIIVKEKKTFLPNFLYSLLLPFFYKREMQECSVYKTTQVFGSWAAVIAKCFYNKPLIVRAGFALSTNLRGQGLLRRSIARVIELFALKNASHVLVTTQAIQTFYAKNTDHISVIPNFVDTKLFLPVQKNSREKIHILFVGRLSPEKNILNLITAIKENEDIILTLVGDGEQKTVLQDFAKDSRAKIDFVGSVQYEKLPEYFASADIFVLPSLFEGHPKVLVEAMAAGLPIIGTRVRGIETLIDDRVTGVLVETSSEDIRRGIEEIIKNAGLRESLKENARRYAEEHFSFEKIVDLERGMYREVLC